MVPVGRMEGPAAEGVESAYVGQRGLVERAARGYEDPRAHGFPVGGPHFPPSRVLVEAGSDDGRSKLDVRTYSVFVRAAYQVLENLALRGKGACPAWIRLEGVRVQVRLDVACGARVVVVAPGAPDFVGSLEDDEVVDPRALEANGHAEPGKAGADDDGLVHWVERHSSAALTRWATVAVEPRNATLRARGVTRRGPSRRGENRTLAVGDRALSGSSRGACEGATRGGRSDDRKGLERG